MKNRTRSLDLVGFTAPIEKRSNVPYQRKEETKMQNIMKSKAGRGGPMGIVITIVMVVIGYLLLTDLFATYTSNFTGISATVVEFIPVMLVVGALVLAGRAALGRR